MRRDKVQKYGVLFVLWGECEKRVQSCYLFGEINPKCMHLHPFNVLFKQETSFIQIQSFNEKSFI